MNGKIQKKLLRSDSKEFFSEILRKEIIQAQLISAKLNVNELLLIS